jgi:hypothetical protein
MQIFQQPLLPSCYIHMQRLCVTFSLIDRETQGRLIDLGPPFPANQILPPAISFYRYASLHCVRTLTDSIDNPNVTFIYWQLHRVASNSGTCNTAVVCPCVHILSVSPQAAHNCDRSSFTRPLQIQNLTFLRTKNRTDDTIHDTGYIRGKNPRVEEG